MVACEADSSRPSTRLTEWIRCPRTTSASAWQRGTTTRYADMFEPAVLDPIVDFLAELAGDGAALELGIGTGRIALPLARRGVRVHGIDLSEAMVARLRAKPGGERDRRDDRRLRHDDGRRHVLARLPRLQHDHEPDDAGRAGRLLPQRRRAPRAGRVLRDRGRRPGLQRLPPGETVPALRRRARRTLGFDEYDVAAQGLVSHHYWIDGRRASRSSRCRSATCGRRSSTSWRGSPG